MSEQSVAWADAPATALFQQDNFEALLAQAAARLPLATPPYRLALVNEWGAVADIPAEWFTATTPWTGALVRVRAVALKDMFEIRAEFEDGKHCARVYDVELARDHPELAERAALALTPQQEAERELRELLQ